MVRSKLIQSLLLLALLSSGGIASAQSVGRPCGDTEHTSWALKHLTRIFTQDRHEQARSMIGVERVSVDAEFRVLSDAKECQPVLREVIRELRTWPGWRTIERNGFDHSIYRIGPYLVVGVDPRTEHGVILQDGGSSLIFDAATLALIRVARV